MWLNPIKPSAGSARRLWKDLDDSTVSADTTCTTAVRWGSWGIGHWTLQITCSRGVHPLSQWWLLHILSISTKFINSLYFRKTYKFRLFSFNLLPPILGMIHLRIMVYTYLSPLTCRGSNTDWTLSEATSVKAPLLRVNSCATASDA